MTQNFDPNAVLTSPDVVRALDRLTEATRDTQVAIIDLAKSEHEATIARNRKADNIERAALATKRATYAIVVACLLIAVGLSGVGYLIHTNNNASKERAAAATEQRNRQERAVYQAQQYNLVVDYCGVKYSTPDAFLNCVSKYAPQGSPSVLPETK